MKSKKGLSGWMVLWIVVIILLVLSLVLYLVSQETNSDVKNSSSLGENTDQTKASTASSENNNVVSSDGFPVPPSFPFE